MKKRLHLLIGNPPPLARTVIDAEKKRADGAVAELPLTTENAAAALEAIFQADSICVWSEPPPDRPGTK